MDVTRFWQVFVLTALLLAMAAYLWRTYRVGIVERLIGFLNRRLSVYRATERDEHPEDVTVEPKGSIQEGAPAAPQPPAAPTIGPIKDAAGLDASYRKVDEAKDRPKDLGSEGSSPVPDSVVPGKDRLPSETSATRNEAADAKSGLTETENNSGTDHVPPTTKAPPSDIPGLEDDDLRVSIEVRGGNELHVHLKGRRFRACKGFMPVLIQLVARLYDASSCTPVRTYPSASPHDGVHDFLGRSLKCAGMEVEGAVGGGLVLQASRLQAAQRGAICLQVAYEVIARPAMGTRKEAVIRGIIRSKDPILINNPGHGQPSVTDLWKRAAVRLMHAQSRVPRGAMQVSNAVYQVILKACSRLKIDPKHDAEARGDAMPPTLEAMLGDRHLEASGAEFRSALLAECDVIRAATIKIDPSLKQAQDEALEKIESWLKPELPQA